MISSIHASRKRLGQTFHHQIFYYNLRYKYEAADGLTYEMPLISLHYPSFYGEAEDVASCI